MMLPGMAPIGWNAAPPLVLAYVTHTGSSSNLQDYSFTSQSFGTEAGNRYIIVGVVGGTEVPTSASIGGITADIHNNGSYSSFLIAAVPTGTSGTVAVSFSSTRTNCAIAIWRAVNLISTTPHDIQQDLTASSNAFSLSLNIPANGGATGQVRANGNGTPRTWTWSSNMSENVDATLEGDNTRSFATANTTGDGLTITATASGSLLDTMGLGVASWR